MNKQDVHEGIMVCPNCGSENIEELRWVSVNDPTNTISWYEGDNGIWCPDCETHPTEIISYNDYENQEHADNNRDSK